MKWAAFCVVTAVGPVVASAAVQYTIRDVGVSGQTTSYGNAINNEGDVVGYAGNGNSTPAQAYLQHSGVSTSLGLPPSATSSAALGVNSTGTLVAVNGMTQSSTSGSITHAYLWSSGSFRDLGTLGGAGGPTEGYSVNDSGVVVGDAALSSAGDAPYHGFAYRNGMMVDLGTLTGGGNSSAQDVNSAGEVVGYAFDSTNHFHAVVWNGTNVTDLGTFGGTNSAAYKISDSGLIVGSVRDAAGEDQAYLYNSQGFHALGSLGLSSYADDVSDDGTVVGHYGLANGQASAFIYSNGTMTDLNSLIPAGSGWVLYDALGINDSHQIVGDGTYNGVQRAFVLTSVPEPSIVAGVGVFSTLLMARRRRRR